MFSRHREPAIRYEKSTSAAALLAAMGVGAALMHFLHKGRALREAPAGDVALTERVRAAMGRVIADPDAIDIRVNDGTVILKGPALTHEIGEIVACAERVRGVRQVENRMSVSNPD